MSRPFTFTPDANADVLGIWRYIAQDDDFATADRVVATIYDASALLTCPALVTTEKISLTDATGSGRSANI